ncbi:amidohydrolase family protein [Nocardiopsis flavescens]
MSAADLVVRGGTVVNADWQGAAEVFVGAGRVLALAEPGAPAPDGSRPEEVDATGLLVLPGGVDPHCHVGFTSGEFTSLDDYRGCTTAAVFGGTTTIVDFAIPGPGQSPLEAVRERQGAAGQGLCDSALHGCVVTWDDTTEEQLAAMAGLGVNTIKMFTTYRGETMADEYTVLRTMKAVGATGGMVVIHCEADHIIEEAQRLSGDRGRTGAEHMGDTRPELAETASVAEVLAIAESVGAPVYFVHQSSAEAVELVAAARRRGRPAYSEAVAHHLVLDEGAYAGEHPERFVCCPPLRPRATVEGLGRHLFTGEISTVGSDHCCYDTAQKERHRHDVRAMPNGLPGVETRLAVLYSEYVAGRGLSATRFVDLVAAAPARLNGLYPRKGVLAPGSDADIVLWDPDARWTVRTGDLHMATDYTPYEGRELTGRARTVVVGGRVVVRDGALADPRPLGRSIPSGPVGPLR